MKTKPLIENLLDIIRQAPHDQTHLDAFMRGAKFVCHSSKESIQTRELNDKNTIIALDIEKHMRCDKNGELLGFSMRRFKGKTFDDVMKDSLLFDIYDYANNRFVSTKNKFLVTASSQEFLNLKIKKFSPGENHQILIEQLYGFDPERITKPVAEAFQLA